MESFRRLRDTASKLKADLAQHLSAIASEIHSLLKPEVLHQSISWFDKHGALKAAWAVGGGSLGSSEAWEGWELAELPAPTAVSVLRVPAGCLRDTAFPPRPHWPWLHPRWPLQPGLKPAPMGWPERMRGCCRAEEGALCGDSDVPWTDCRLLFRSAPPTSTLVNKCPIVRLLFFASDQ